MVCAMYLIHITIDTYTGWYIVHTSTVRHKLTVEFCQGKYMSMMRSQLAYNLSVGTHISVACTHNSYCGLQSYKSKLTSPLMMILIKHLVTVLR